MWNGDIFFKKPNIIVKPSGVFMLRVVPAQSLGADVIIVQGGEDAVDDGALVLGPLNHGDCLGLCSGFRETKRLNSCATRPSPF